MTVSPSLLDRVPVIPVVVIDDVAHAVPVARALVAGGIPMIELTLRTSCALDAIKAIATEVPDICVGAGTIVEPDQAARAAEAGAQFLVSPGSTESLLKAMTDTGLPHLPGAATVSEVLFLLEHGYRELKFFPAEASGVPSFSARSIRPFPRPGSAPPAGCRPRMCGTTWHCPTSGVSADPGSLPPTP